MIDHRNPWQHHRDTIPHVKAAIRSLAAAIREQDGLEWTGQLQSSMEDLKFSLEKLERDAARRE